jgi:hypothetical protein
MANRCRSKVGHDQHAHSPLSIRARPCGPDLVPHAREDAGLRGDMWIAAPDGWSLSPSGAACLIVGSRAVCQLNVRRVFTGSCLRIHTQEPHVTFPADAQAPSCPCLASS